MMIKKSRLFVASVLLIGLAGCATPEPELTPQPLVTPTPTPVPTPVPAPAQQPVVPVVTDASVLKEGVALYNNGDYNGAIKRLTTATNEIWSATGSRLVQLEALKYSAFSYCVSGRQVQCRQQFEKALKLDIGFDLVAGEKGHPLWGPVFSKAQKAALKAARKTKK